MNPTHQRLHNIILLLNTAGLLGYLAWLVLGHEHILYNQKGVLFLLPCLPFTFIYLFLIKHRRPEVDDDHDWRD